MRKATLQRGSGPSAAGSPGSESRACAQQGSPGTWEARSLPRVVVAPPEATKGGGTSDRESERLHSTDEAGKLVPRGAGGGKGGVGNTELQEGQMTGTSSLDTISTKLLQVATRVRDRLRAQRDRESRSRMPELGTSGSAGGPLAAAHGSLYTGTKVETPDTAKGRPTG